MDFVDPTGLSPLQYLAKVKTSFEADAKSRILGKPDALFFALASALSDDKYASLRTRRTSMAINVQHKLATGLPADQKTATETQLRFFSSVMPDLQAVKTDITAAKMARTLSAVATEFQASVASYIEAAGTEPDEARDKRFESTAASIQTKLSVLVLAQKGRLRGENEFYNVSIVNASKRLAEVKAALAAFVPGTPAPAATVPPAADATGGTLDVTA